MSEGLSFCQRTNICYLASFESQRNSNLGPQRGSLHLFNHFFVCIHLDLFTTNFVTQDKKYNLEEKLSFNLSLEVLSATETKNFKIHLDAAPAPIKFSKRLNFLQFKSEENQLMQKGSSYIGSMMWRSST